jgi:hypothetical protein
MPFERGLTTPFINGVGHYNGPWTNLAGKALPKSSILVWAPHPRRNYTFNLTPAAEYDSLFEHMADSGMMPNTISCDADGATYNSTWIPSAGVWVSHSRMNAAVAQERHATYTAQGYQRTSSFTCGSVTAAVWRK